jgi:uncharacterized membrane protein
VAQLLSLGREIMSAIKTKEATSSSTILRIIAMSVAVLLTVSLAFLVYHQFHIRNNDPTPRILQRIVGSIMGLVEATIAILCWWYALRGHLKTQSRAGRIASLIEFAFLGGVIFGFFGFSIGFFGPIIIDEIRSTDSPQGPLLGIFVTGPLGFVAGIIAGLVYGCIRNSKQKSKQTQPNNALEPTPTAPPVLPKP